MPSAAWLQAELQGQRDKLASSYQELLDEFNSNDLRTVGNYTVGRLIGKGSFGKVYLATHKLTNGSKVVLKSAKKDDPNLAREIHHHRQFVHPHIARLYEVIVTENLVWLVLEYCPGDELYNHLLEHGRMEEGHVQKVFTQLLGAVSYVHLKGCVHRDLKLENILLDKHGNVKLVDFGFTREYSGSTSYLQTWCGTLCYSAPEMIKGEKYGGEKVDVWSLGIILYALLRGELPFDDDDDTVTKTRILKEDPIYPEDFPPGAKELCQKLLSKRPLLRPSLADILRHTWLTEHAPQQQETLKLQQPPPFTTPLEQETLERMRSAGVDIDLVIEHVLGQRCDGLAGWWNLLLEKEECKAKRRERKKREKELEEKRLRRLSAASGRLLAAPSLREINEEGQMNLLSEGLSKPRGRKASRSNASSLPPHTPDLGLIEEARTPPPDLPQHPERLEKDRTRSTSSTRRRPPPPPKEMPKEMPKEPSPRPRAVSRHSGTMLRQLQQNPSFLGVPDPNSRRKKLYQQPLRAQLTRIKSWFTDMPKRKNAADTQANDMRNPKDAQPELRRNSTAQLLEVRRANQQGSRPDMQTRATYPNRPRLSTNSSQGSQGSSMTRAQAKRLSLSPQPLTPRSSYKRRSGLGGRKSTSSSVSSVRSIHMHHPSHSKASSTSSTSNSMASPNLSNPPRSSHSPHPSVKVLPAPPGTTLPTNIRVSRRGPPGGLGTLSLPSFADIQQDGALQSSGAFSAIGPPSPGMHAVFARGKRKVFKGPTGLGASPRNRIPTPSGSGGAGIGSRDQSLPRRSMESRGFAITEEEEEDEEQMRGGVDVDAVDKQILEVKEAQRAAHFNTGASPGLEEEDEDEDIEVEEVDTFSPLSDGDISEIGDGYFASTHAAEVEKGLEGPDQDGPAGKPSSGGLDHMARHDRASSQDTPHDATSPKVNINMHEEDSPILKQTRTLDSVKEGDERPHEATATSEDKTAQCALCIQKSNGST
ncbi:hypothetical protein MBLNU457_1926t2 [Dothideomycetes sp. NU457]